MKKENDKTNNNGVASLVLGIIGLVFSWVPFIFLPVSILAVVFARKQNKIMTTGQATAGNVLGIIGIVLNSISLLFGTIMVIALIVGASLI